MSDDGLRDEVAGVLYAAWEQERTSDYEVAFEAHRDYFERQADALLPLLARVRDEARVEALREAAEAIGPNGGADRWLRDRAAALDPEATR